MKQVRRVIQASRYGATFKATLTGAFNTLALTIEEY